MSRSVKGSTPTGLVVGNNEYALDDLQSLRELGFHAVRMDKSKRVAKLCQRLNPSIVIFVFDRFEELWKRSKGCSEILTTDPQCQLASELMVRNPKPLILCDGLSQVNGAHVIADFDLSFCGDWHYLWHHYLVKEVDNLKRRGTSFLVRKIRRLCWCSFDTPLRTKHCHG